MRRPWKQRNEFSELESELRAARPEPRSDLISQLVGRVEATRVPFRRSGARLALAGALTSVALVAFALVGGFSYTAAAAKSVAKATGISNSHSSNAGGKKANSNANANANPAARQYQERVVICHRPPGNPSNGQTLTLPPQAAQHHLAHHPDDSLGPC
jgi:hypothetical protein